MSNWDITLTHNFCECMRKNVWKKSFLLKEQRKRQKVPAFINKLLVLQLLSLECKYHLENINILAKKLNVNPNKCQKLMKMKFPVLIFGLFTLYEHKYKDYWESKREQLSLVYQFQYFEGRVISWKRSTQIAKHCFGNKLLSHRIFCLFIPIKHNGNNIVWP